jgi:hypothetical protein
MPSAASADKVAKADDSDTKANKKSSPSATQRKDSPSGSNSRPSQPSGPSNGTVEKHLSVPPPSENESDVAEKESPVTRNQTANSARQMAVPLEIQNRPRSNSGSNSRSGRNATNSQKQQSPATPGEAKSRDVKPLAPGDEKMDEPAPALVRMLIVIEREPQEPAAPAAKKDPSGGAS